MTDSISFSDYSLYDCLLPSSIPVGPSLSTLKSRGVKVFWFPDAHKPDERYKLNLDTGLWQNAPLSNVDGLRRRLRSSSDTTRLMILRSKGKTGDQSFQVIGPRLWNQLPVGIRVAVSVSIFKDLMKTFLFTAQNINE
ncbi:hypothetical protein BSL78_25127 [Apostichopus japonicus]|uniref:Uncharacterized protein n=1 Tax=Stichopus japonicus TaxID=307972 RepID=A0A2G8JQK7_STIJA|nr:hypothetical protein BSL78_25127 [Apostichopus japonicus]